MNIESYTYLEKVFEIRKLSGERPWCGVVLGWYYEDNIKDMMSSGLSYYEISHIDYDLRDVVKHLKGEE